MAQEVLQVKLTLDGKEYELGMKQAEKSTANFMDKVEYLGERLSVVLTAPLALAGFQGMKTAMNLEESFNKVEVAFGKAADSIKQFSETTVDAFGISQGAALDMSGTFGDMATSMGISQTEAAKMATSLVGLAGDLASFKNIPIAEAVTALNSVFTGETESLKMLGVVMTEVNLKAFALQKGITKKYETMTEAERVLLRYNFVLEKTRNAQGDYARTSDGATNATRTMQERFKEVTGDLMNQVLPIYTQLVLKVNDILKSVSELSPEMKQLIVIIGGIVGIAGPVMLAIAGISTAIGTLGAAALPIAGIVMGITTALALLFEHKAKIDSVAAATMSMEDATRKANLQIQTQTDKVQSLLEVLRNEKSTQEEVNKAKAELISISPKFQSALEGSKIDFEKLADATSDYVTELQKVARAEVLLEQQRKNIALQEQERLNPGASLSLLQKGEMFLKSGFGLGVLGNYASNVAVASNEIVNKLQETNKKIGKELQAIGKTITGTTTTDTGTGDTGIEGIGVGTQGDGVNKDAGTIQFGQKFLKGIQKMKDDVEIAYFDALKFVQNFKDSKLQGLTLEGFFVRQLLSGGTEVQFVGDGLPATFQKVEDNIIKGMEGRIQNIQNGIRNFSHKTISAYRQSIYDLTEEMEKELSKSVEQVFELGLESAALSIEGIFTQIFGGEFDWKQAAAGMLNGLASIMQELGKHMITLGMAKEAFKVALKDMFGGGVGLIVAGGALIAGAAAIRGYSNSISQRSTASSAGSGGSNFTAPTFNVQGSLVAKGTDLVAVINNTKNLYGA